MLVILAASIVAAGQTFTCTPTHVWDGDGPVWCAEGPHIRIAGIAAREMDGTCRSNQPCPSASATKARDALVSLLGGPRGTNPHRACHGSRSEADLPLRRVCRRQQDGRMVPSAFGRRSLLRLDRYGHGASLGSLLEGTGVPVGGDLHLTGHLEEGPTGLLLHTGGGIWELEATRRSRRLIGCEVEVTGQRAGFIGIVCDHIWLAGQPRPRRLRLNIEYLLAIAVTGYGLVAFLLGLTGYLR